MNATIASPRVDTPAIRRRAEKPIVVVRKPRPNRLAPFGNPSKRRLPSEHLADPDRDNSCSEGRPTPNTANNSGQYRTAGVLSGVAKRPGLPAFYQGLFSKKRVSRRFGAIRVRKSRIKSPASRVLPATASAGWPS